jgi:hypothetical protein
VVSVLKIRACHSQLDEFYITVCDVCCEFLLDAVHMVALCS